VVDLRTTKGPLNVQLGIILRALDEAARHISPRNSIAARAFVHLTELIKTRFSSSFGQIANVARALTVIIFLVLATMTFR